MEEQTVDSYRSPFPNAVLKFLNKNSLKGTTVCSLWICATFDSRAEDRLSRDCEKFNSSADQE